MRGWVPAQEPSDIGADKVWSPDNAGDHTGMNGDAGMLQEKVLSSLQPSQNSEHKKLME